MFGLINNKSKLLGDDLKREIKGGSKLRVAAYCFSVYAFNALKAELEQIDELKFLFTTPTPIDEQVADKVKKQQRLVDTEKQPKRRFELNDMLKQKKKELEELNG